jgi:uncharacterized protein
MPVIPQLNKLVHFFLVKLFIGLLVIGCAVALVEFGGHFLFEAFPINKSLSNFLVACLQAIIAVTCYILLFRAFEKRQIQELSRNTWSKYAYMGFATGLILQTSFIIVIYLAGGYKIIRTNSFAAMVPAFTTALSAGFVAEILIRGVCFRILEEKLGTALSMAILVIFFALIHSRVQGANLLSVLATAAQAGFLLSAAFVLTRSLWFTIFIHFSWDFTEPGIFGAINPGNNVSGSLFTSAITGSTLITGGGNGPQNALPALFFCTVLGILFLWMANRNENFIKPYWKK